MKNPTKTVVEKMFAAFSSGNADKFVSTVSDDTVWIFHGKQIIPKGQFEKKEGV
jgi:ketosteroid isomerase-like protein